MAQQVMVDATTSYMNVLRDTAVVQLQRYNVEMLEEQLRHTRQRLMVREVTTTDVSTNGYRVWRARAGQRLAANSALLEALALYQACDRRGAERDIGSAHHRWIPHVAPQYERGGGRGAEKANPSVLAAQLGIDVASVQVKIAEGALYPTAKA